MVSMVVQPLTSQLTLFLLQYPCQPSFFAKNDRGRPKKREGVDQGKRNIFHTCISFELI